MNALETIIANMGTYEEREAFSKTRNFSSTMTPFLDLGLNQSKKVGKLMESIKHIPAGNNATFAEWFYYYFENVLTPEQALEYITEFQNYRRTSLEFATKVWVVRILQHTYRGWKNEILVKEVIKNEVKSKHGDSWTVEEVDDYTDRNYAVDIVIKNEEGVIVSGIQVKPTSYFIGGKKYTKYERCVLNPVKNLQFENKYNAPVFYVKIEDALSGNIEYINYKNIKE